MSSQVSPQNILSPLSREISIDNDCFSEATTNLQSATKESLVFYRMTDSSQAEKNFFSRLPKEIGCLVTNHLPQGFEGNYILVDEDNFLEAQKRVADKLYPLSRGRNTLLAVTGTNGKTTTVEFIRQICLEKKIGVATVGTLGFYKNEKRIENNLNATSPSYLELRKLLHDCGDQIDIVALEVSSHALAQNRFYDIEFTEACWTTFSQDHLDYHRSLSAYFAAKLKILEKLSKKAKLNISERSAKLKKKLESFENVFIVPSFEEETYQSNPLFRADYNKMNFELAYHMVNQIFSLESERQSLAAKITSPAGRFMTRTDSLGRMAVVDYAHTPEALENICQTLSKSLKPGEKLLTVFGCGGDRDKKKRPLMGEIACRLSDAVILTDDNPRTESSYEILGDIERGCFGSVEVVADREQAIQKAIQSKNYKVILIAGKGHEEYQEVNGQRFDFSDIKMVEKFMESCHEG